MVWGEGLGMPWCAQLRMGMGAELLCLHADKSKAKKASKKKERFYFDFEEDTPDWTTLLGTSTSQPQSEACFLWSWLNVCLVVAHCMLAGRAATTLSQATLTKGGVDNLLPEDKHYQVDTLRRLFSKPTCMVSACIVLARERVCVVWQSGTREESGADYAFLACRQPSCQTPKAQTLMRMGWASSGTTTTTPTMPTTTVLPQVGRRAGRDVRCARKP